MASSQYNLKSPAVKRLMKEASELRFATEDYFAQPIEENLFEWHFTFRGPKDSPFSEGIYHGRIILPTDYPLHPPHLFLFTPNGRFQTNKKICLNISGHHPESWQPSYSIRVILLALIGFMPSEGLGTIGSLDYTTEERKELARKSVDWTCNVCGKIKDLLKERGEDQPTDKAIKKDDDELLKMINFKGDVDQQHQATQSTSIKKVITKISTQDDNLNNQQSSSNNEQDNNDLLNTSHNHQNNLTNSTDLIGQASQQSQTTLQNNNLNSNSNNNNGIFTRLSPTLIIALIVLIILKRLYSTIF